MASVPLIALLQPQARKALLGRTMPALPTLHVLTGPTAVGKTALALSWAETNQAEIISCDSLLIYQGMDIGTAKPSREERHEVPHHLVDIRAVDQPMNIAQYVVSAQAAVADLTRRGRKILITGGSGFYLQAFFGAVTDEVVVPDVLRQEVARRLERDGLGPLVAQLRDLNPQGLGGLDVANPRRVTRALERCRASGRTLLELTAAFATRRGAFADHPIRAVCLDREPAELNDRIERRIDGMLAAGLIDEVKGLLDHGLRQNPSAVRSIGYRETVAMLDGKLAMGDLAATIARHTRTLVKKQRTWFRGQLPQLPSISAHAVSADHLF